jgi:plasmid stability protein
MATLYVENVPDDLYSALRERAQQNRKSIAAEVLSLLEQNIPTAAELKRRQKLVKQLARIRSSPLPGAGPFASSELMIREDRER